MPQTSTSLLANTSFSFSWDLLIIIGAIVVILLYGFTSGKNRILTLLISTYFSFLIVVFLPWLEIREYFNYKEDFPSPTFETFVFLALILAFCFLLPNSILGSGLRLSKTGRSSWWQIIVFSILLAGLLASLVLSFLPVEDLPELNSLVEQLFIGNIAQSAWLILPILGIFLIRKGRGEI